MDPTSRLAYPQFSADWKTLGYDDPLRTPNLATAIHPVLEKCHGSYRRFGGTDVEYEMIRPAIQLASNYLYSPKGCLFLYSLVYAKRKPVATKFNLNSGPIKLENLEFKVTDLPCTEFRRLDEYCPKRMNHIFEELAFYNMFGPKDMPMAGGTALIPKEGKTPFSRLQGIHSYLISGGDQDPPYKCSTQGILEKTHANFYDHLGADMRGIGRRGNCTFIGFNSYFLQDIKKLIHNGQANSLQMLNIQFSLAITLCHEVAHAVVTASNSDVRKQMTSTRCTKLGFSVHWPVEPFFEDQETAEIGYCWESETLGGKLMAPPPGFPEKFSSIVDWPEGDEHGNEEACVAYPQRGPRKNRLVDAFVVNMQYIQMVFCQDFWDTWARLPTAEERGLVLTVPRTVGFVMDRVEFTEEQQKKFSKAQYNEYWERRHRRVVWNPATNLKGGRGAVCNGETFQKAYNLKRLR